MSQMVETSIMAGFEFDEAYMHRKIIFNFFKHMYNVASYAVNFIYLFYIVIKTVSVYNFGW